MKTFKIRSAHDIYIDDYEQGELDRVNGYTVTNEVEANYKTAKVNGIEIFLN